MSHTHRAPAARGVRRVMGALPGLLVMVLAATGARASAFDDTTWNLTGTSTARIGNVSQAAPVNATLSIMSDRTYLLVDNDPSTPDEIGVWFENRGRLLLFTQNILEQILALESALGVATGDTVRLSILKGSGKASLNSSTGLLTLQSSFQMSAFLMNANLTLGLSLRSTLTGTLAP